MITAYFVSIGAIFLSAVVITVIAWFRSLKMIYTYMHALYSRLNVAGVLSLIIVGITWPLGFLLWLIVSPLFSRTNNASNNVFSQEPQRLNRRNTRELIMHSGGGRAPSLTILSILIIWIFNYIIMKIPMFGKPVFPLAINFLLLPPISLGITLVSIRQLKLISIILGTLPMIVLTAFLLPRLARILSAC